MKALAKQILADLRLPATWKDVFNDLILVGLVLAMAWNYNWDTWLLAIAAALGVLTVLNVLIITTRKSRK